MQIVATAGALKTQVQALRGQGRRVALVPTMGNLHAGHQRLCTAARDHAQAVVASIYVNPLQFGPQEDYANYPRTPQDDQALLRASGVDLLFLPEEGEIYPRGRQAQTTVEVPGLSDILCGAARPGHFRGVTTVVARLLHLAAPDVALFGKKDYQQWLLIRLMAQDLGLPVAIVGVDTVRAPDGLALSSRNSYLSAAERLQAPRLHAALRRAADDILKGQPYSAVEAQGLDALKAVGMRPDYFSVRRRADLAVPEAETPGNRRQNNQDDDKKDNKDRALVILAAAWLGRARLIDNVEVDLDRGD